MLNYYNPKHWPEHQEASPLGAAVHDYQTAFHTKRAEVNEQTAKLRELKRELNALRWKTGTAMRLASAVRSNQPWEHFLRGHLRARFNDAERLHLVRAVDAMSRLGGLRPPQPLELARRAQELEQQVQKALEQRALEQRVQELREERARGDAISEATDRLRKATPTVKEAAENLAAAYKHAPSVEGLKDSGKRRDFTTGSVRDDAEGKGRYDLLSPIALHYQARHTERGALKYAARNWEKGQPVSVFMNSAIRHLERYLAGWRDEDHLAAAAWNVHGIIHVEHQIARGQLPAELLDWPQPYVTEEDVQGRVYNGEPSYQPGEEF